MREKLRKYGSDILYYSLSFIATLIVWLAHDLDRIGVLKEVDFSLELMWWLILMLFVWAGELLPVAEPDYGPEINRRNRDRADGFGHGDFYCAACDGRDVPVAAVLIVERRGHPARESRWKYLWGHGILRAREENKEKNMNDKPEEKEK